jgi:hypothetical protein
MAKPCACCNSLNLIKYNFPHALNGCETRSMEQWLPLVFCVAKDPTLCRKCRNASCKADRTCASYILKELDSFNTERSEPNFDCLEAKLKRLNVPGYNKIAQLRKLWIGKTKQIDDNDTKVEILEWETLRICLRAIREIEKPNHGTWTSWLKLIHHTRFDVNVHEQGSQFFRRHPALRNFHTQVGLSYSSKRVLSL